MSKERRKQPLSPKELAAIREEKAKAREASPQERRRRFVINFGVGILLFCFLLTSGIVCMPMGSVSKSAQQAEEAAKHTDPVSADVERWKKEAEAKPNDLSVVTNYAYYLIERGDHNAGKDTAKADYAAAEVELQKVVKANPEYPFALRLLAKLKIRDGKYDEAKTQFEAALKAAQKPVDPKDPEKDAKENNAKNEQVQALMGLADIAMRRNDHATALKSLDAVIAINPGEMEAYSNRAEIYFLDKQPELARKDLNTVMQIAQAMGPSQSTMMAAQRAQVMLYMIDQPAPNPSGTPAAPVAPASATPAPPAPPTAPASPVAPTTPVAPPSAATPVPANATMATPAVPVSVPTP